MTADVLSHSVEVTNDTNNVAPYPLFSLLWFFSVRIKYTVIYMDIGVKFQLGTSSRLFNYQRF